MSAGCLKEEGIDARLVMLGFVHGSDPMEVQNQRFEEQEFCAKFAQNSFGGSVAWISR